MDPGHLIFLLSPANTAGRRAGYLLRDNAPSNLAQRLRSPEGASVGEVYTFMSGLYFRGKLAYAAAFGRPPEGRHGSQVIVPGLGLCAPSDPINLEVLHAIGRVPVDPDDRRFTTPLQRDATSLAKALGPKDLVVLLGSIATPKYLEPLTQIFGSRLHFPQEFVGLGDMSRGSIMLKCAAERRELTYVAALGASAESRSTAMHGRRTASEK